MAYDKYDPRLESIVVETSTVWSPELSNITDQDKVSLARAIHEHPELATKIRYERMHTGMMREITVTVADLERVYAMRLGG
ncbi:MAG: hypothetical protein KDA36_13215 [Planctomycetaceae bacterium]|nr:hypothetical protein [Planctomycetaceae bacterium]